MRSGPAEIRNSERIERARERACSAGKIKRAQARAEVTDSKILDAAQALFSEQGFDNTQLEQIAAYAGYTRGAIYCRYEDKHELFLDLLERRVYSKVADVYEALEKEATIAGRRAVLKSWIAARASDASWIALILEFKLYAIRHPEWRRKTRMGNLLSTDHVRCLVEMICKEPVSQSEEDVLRRRLTIVGSTLCAMALENQLRPGFLARHQMQEVAQEVFEVLFTPRFESYTEDSASPHTAA